MLAARDGFGLLTSVHCPQLGRALLQLTHLEKWGEQILGNQKLNKEETEVKKWKEKEFVFQMTHKTQLL